MQFNNQVFVFLIETCFSPGKLKLSVISLFISLTQDGILVKIWLVRDVVVFRLGPKDHSSVLLMSLLEKGKIALSNHGITIT